MANKREEDQRVLEEQIKSKYGYHLWCEADEIIGHAIEKGDLHELIGFGAADHKKTLQEFAKDGRISHRQSAKHELPREHGFYCFTYRVPLGFDLEDVPRFVQCVKELVDRQHLCGPHRSPLTIVPRLPRHYEILYARAARSPNDWRPSVPTISADTAAKHLDPFGRGNGGGGGTV